MSLTFLHAQALSLHISAADRLGDWLTNPIVMTVLLIVGIAGVVTELFMPGVMIPGTVGVAAFVLYFFGNYAAGYAKWEDIALFALGLVLLIAELFIPSFGIIGTLGIASLLSGVVLAACSTGQAVLSLGTALLVNLVLIAILFKYFKHRGLWNRLVLTDRLSRDKGYSSTTDKTPLLGKQGITLTALRPAGTAIIEDQQVDVVTPGQFIAARTPVVVMKVEGSRVVVRTQSKDGVD